MTHSSTQRVRRMGADTGAYMKRANVALSCLNAGHMICGEASSCGN